MAVPWRAAALRLRLVAAAVTASPAATGPKVPAIFVFDDSTADVGNNDYLPGSSTRANFPHNGVDFPGGEPTGRFSNGLIGIDFLAVDMGFSRSPRPYLSLVAAAAAAASCGGDGKVMSNKTKKRMASAASMRGANFASGCAGILDSTGATVNMTKQIEYFSDLKDQMSTRLSTDRASALLSKSIFLISAGANDVFDFFSQNRSPDSTALQQFSEAVISA